MWIPPVAGLELSLSPAPGFDIQSHLVLAPGHTNCQSLCSSPAAGTDSLTHRHMCIMQTPSGWPCTAHSSRSWSWIFSLLWCLSSRHMHTHTGLQIHPLVPQHLHHLDGTPLVPVISNSSGGLSRRDTAGSQASSAACQLIRPALY